MREGRKEEVVMEGRLERGRLERRGVRERRRLERKKEGG